MSSSQSSSPVSSITSANYKDDLFKKFKLKHHRRTQSICENDDQIDINNSDEWTSKSTTPELDVEPHFENYYKQQSPPSVHMEFAQHLLTPDIEELQRKENDLVQSLNTFHQQDCSLSEYRGRFIRDQNRPYMQCGVCHDRATGIHYGLATCEGCKGIEFDFEFIFNKNIFCFQDFLNEQFKIKKNIVVLEMVHVL